MYSGMDAHAQAGLSNSTNELTAEVAERIKRNGISKIAVVGFSDLNGYQSALGDYIADVVTRGLVNNSDGRYGVVERRRLDQVLQEQSLSATGLLDEATVAELQRILGVDAIITGTLTHFPSTEEIEIGVSVISTETALVKASSAKIVAATGRIADLLNQRARVGSASPLPTSTQVQRRDVFFQNSFLRVDVESISLSSDSEYVVLALRFTNQTQEVLRFVFEYDSAKLVSSRGHSLDDHEESYRKDNNILDGTLESNLETIDAGSSSVFLYKFGRSSVRDARVLQGIDENTTFSFTATIATPQGPLVSRRSGANTSGLVSLRAYRIGISGIEL
jgi:hypothetical protein